MQIGSVFLIQQVEVNSSPNARKTVFATNDPEVKPLNALMLEPMAK